MGVRQKSRASLIEDRKINEDGNWEDDGWSKIRLVEEQGGKCGRGGTHTQWQGS